MHVTKLYNNPFYNNRLDFYKTTSEEKIESLTEKHSREKLQLENVLIYSIL